MLVFAPGALSCTSHREPEPSAYEQGLLSGRDAAAINFERGHLVLYHTPADPLLSDVPEGFTVQHLGDRAPLSECVLTPYQFGYVRGHNETILGLLTTRR